MSRSRVREGWGSAARDDAGLTVRLCRGSDAFKYPSLETREDGGGCAGWSGGDEVTAEEEEKRTRKGNIVGERGASGNGKGDEQSSPLPMTEAPARRYYKPGTVRSLRLGPLRCSSSAPSQILTELAPLECNVSHDMARICTRFEAFNEHYHLWTRPEFVGRSEDVITAYHPAIPKALLFNSLPPPAA